MIQSWQNLTNITNKLYHLNSYGLIKVTGDDSVSFLQGQLSCDMQKITDTESRLGCYVNTKGKIDAIIRIIKIKDNEFILKLPSELSSIIIKELKKYAVISKVEIKPINSDKYTCFGFNMTTEVLNKNYNLLPKEYNQATIKSDNHIINISTNNNINAFEVIAKKNKSLKLWQELCEVIEPESEKEAQDLYILLKIPEVYKNTYQVFFPHYIGLIDLNAVSFTKGCYRGQEIVARMQHRGNIKHGLELIKCSNAKELSQSDISSNHDIFIKNNEGFKSIGKIVRSNLTQQGQLLILAQLPLEFDGDIFVKSNRDDAYVEIAQHHE